MWNIINTNDEVRMFMEEICYFHDSCIKEISYISGAYVDENISMFPINNRRVLRVVVQRQYKKDSMIEMEFQGLNYLKLHPVGEESTCEIMNSTMFIKDGFIYWCDCGGLSQFESDDYASVFVCASALKWRSIVNHMGEKEFYHSDM